MIDDIIEILFHLYGLLKCRRKHILSSVNKDKLSEWIINRYKHQYINLNDIKVCQISLFGLASNEPYSVPLDIEKICNDMDQYITNKYDYYKNISTIIYNDDKFTTYLSIYVVPFDGVDYTVYEICSKIEALASI